MASDPAAVPSLQIIDTSNGNDFIVPVKRIHDGDDVAFFLSSRAYADIMTFIFQLNTAMIPRKAQSAASTIHAAKAVKLNDPDILHPPAVQGLAKLLESLTTIIEEAPPDPGPRRFGNVSFRKWYEIIRERVPALLDEHLPPQVLALTSTSDVSAKSELEAYLIGSFGSSQRLDYGTGHELSLLAFLGCLWKLGAFPASSDGDQERAIVLGVIEPYLVLIRRLILTYTLEPAGSHGVWGLDDHSFIPYIFGSAQFSPAILTPADVATEGSSPDAPNPADIAKVTAVERERFRNMYFSAIGFIYDVKTGPFWEHSPILYDISGVKAGWAKINKGMIKMYNAEVLSKFPVVQHFPFGSLFAWEKDPNAKTIQANVHTSSQPKSATPLSTTPTARHQHPPIRGLASDVSRTPGPPQTQAPLRNPLADPRDMAATAAPWTSARTGPPTSYSSNQTTRAPWAAKTPAPPVPSGPDQPTKAPWASRTPAPPPPVGGTAQKAKEGADRPRREVSGAADDIKPSTKAPWAAKRS